MTEKAINELNGSDTRFIDSENVARRAIKILESRDGPITPHTFYDAVHMHFKGIARGCLRRHYDPAVIAQEAQQDDGQFDLFSREVQAFYPDPNKRGTYKPVNTITPAEAQIIAARMTATGKSLIKHAKIFLRYVNNRYRKAAGNS